MDANSFKTSQVETVNFNLDEHIPHSPLCIDCVVYLASLYMQVDIYHVIGADRPRLMHYFFNVCKNSPTIQES